MTIFKRLRYVLEGLAIYVLYGFFSLLPLDAASNTGGWIGRTIGPRLAASRKARRNLKMAFPNEMENTYDDWLSGMWDNLGRVFAEYPHLKQICEQRVSITGIENFSKRKTGKAALFFSAHMANWEVPGPALNILHHILGILVYRPPNNPIADRLLLQARQINPEMVFTTKSEQGVREMIKQLKGGGVVGLLIDQKFNRGIPIEFFGQSAMTSSAFIDLARKYDAALVPLQIIRTKGANFIIHLYPDMSDKTKSIEEMLRETHILLESWIKEHPEQWLWLHRRWGKMSDDEQEENNNDAL